MPDFSFDADQFFSDFSRKTYKLSDVQDKLVRVAFDVVRFRDAEPDELWQITSDSDGQYIVARYEDATIDVSATKTASTNPWSVAVNAGSVVNIFYKAYPVAKFAASELGVQVSDVASLQSYLPKRLATDTQLVSALLKTLTPTERYQFLRNNPELQAK